MTTLFAEPDGLWRLGSPDEVARLLLDHHYLGPRARGGITFVSFVGQEPAGAAIWGPPTSRRLPSDGSWLELARWCLTPMLGSNAGSRSHRQMVAAIRQRFPKVTTLVSYSDPGHGHNGALYRACNWQWAPTWHRLRPPPSGLGAWTPGDQQGIKDRWVFQVRPDSHREDLLRVNDGAAIRAWVADAPAHELAWAARSPSPDLRAAVA